MVALDRTNWLQHISKSVAVCSLSLPLLVPFSTGRNIDLQAGIVWVLGTIAWLSLFLWRTDTPSLRRWLWWPIGLYALSCLLTLWFHPDVANLTGLPHSRLGVLSLLACIGCGLVSRFFSVQRLARGLYASSIAIAITAVPYTLITMGSLARVGGAFHQPDLLAIWLVCGWIIGFGLWPQAKKQRWGMAATQTLLLVVIVLSQSRMALLLLIVISLVIAVRQLRGRLRTMAVLLIIGVTGLVGSSAYLVAPHNRVIDSGYSTRSIQYRLTLQSYGVHAVSYQPIVGYGPANIQTGISCLIIHDPALIRTCQQGYYFESSHNIFLDRFIGLGLLGGSAYIIAIGGLLYIGKRQIGIARYVWYAALAICVYYLTNITSVSIELLLWVLLCRFGGSYEDNEA